MGIKNSYCIGLERFHGKDLNILYTYAGKDSFKVADLNFGCATFCALPSFGAVTTFSQTRHSLLTKGA